MRDGCHKAGKVTLGVSTNMLNVNVAAAMA